MLYLLCSVALAKQNVATILRQARSKLAKNGRFVKKLKYQRNIVQTRPCLQFPLFLQCLHLYSPERKLEGSCKLGEPQSLVGHRLLCSSPLSTPCKPWKIGFRLLILIASPGRLVLIIDTPCKPWYIVSPR